MKILATAALLLASTSAHAFDARVAFDCGNGATVLSGRGKISVEFAVEDNEKAVLKGSRRANLKWDMNKLWLNGRLCKKIEEH